MPKPRRWRSLKFRFFLLGVLAGVIPLATMVVTFRMVSHSLKEDLYQALSDIKAREGRRLDEQQRALMDQQVRDKVLSVAEHVAYYLKATPRRTWEELCRDPQFRDAALQPLGRFGETFLWEPASDRILLHGQRELEGEPLSRLMPLPDAASLNHLGGHRTLYEINLTPTEGAAGRGHLFLVRVPVRPAGGTELMVGALPHPGEIAQVIAPTAAILKTALNQSQALLATRLKLFQHQLLVFLAILGILGFWVGLVMIRRLTRQICSLTRAAEAFNRGELDYRIPKPGDDELGRLAQTLNQMAASLKENTVSRFVWENTFNIIPDLIMVLDADQRITRLNRAAAEHLGTTPEEARGRPCCELLPAASEAPPVFALLNGVSAGNQGQKEFYWEHQGRTFLGTVNLLSNRDGQIVGAVHVSRDLTVFKQMQRDLAHASHFLNLIVDAAPLALAVVNREGLFTHINPQVLEEYGYSPDEILDRHFSILYANDSEMQQVLAELQEHGEVLNRQVEFRHKDGRRVPARLSIRKLLGEDGEVLGSVALSSNITEEISLQRQLEAAQKQEAIATLAGGLAHNFNNLLMIIVGLTTLMLSKITPEHPFYSDLKEIERQVRAGREITRKLLSFRRGTNDENRPMDLNSLVEFTADMFARTRRELLVTKDLAPDLPAVEVDPGQIQQVLMNLLINSWHAMPQGGEITLRTSVVRLTAWRDPNFQVHPGRYVCLSVSDTGHGIDEETKTHLFEPFFTTKDPGKGSGLGLASAYRIIKNHRGAIRVTSAPGQGATFDLYLPASDAPAQTLTPKESKIVTGQGTILVVDDEPLLRRVAGKLLQKLGYRVLEASGGEMALEIFQEKGAHIDLVLLDLIMPGLNGYQTLERLRSLNPQVRVLLCSGYGEQEEEALPPGVDFLSKPYPLEVLSQRVSEVLHRQVV